jgi:hypothetical protein
VTAPFAPEVTRLLLAWRQEDDAALERLMPLVYRELRTLAHARMRREGQGHTLQTTALVNEAYLRLADARRVSWQNRSQLSGPGARAMRCTPAGESADILFFQGLALAPCGGSRVETQKTATSLAKINRPFLNGRYAFERARTFAKPRDREGAMRALQSAFVHGHRRMTNEMQLGIVQNPLHSPFICNAPQTIARGGT